MKWVISMEDLKPPMTDTQGDILLKDSMLLNRMIADPSLLKRVLEISQSRENEIAMKGLGSPLLAAMKTGMAELDENFNIYPDKNALAKALSNYYHPWVEYDLNKLYFSDNYPRLQKDYMIFCGGWLQFWDRNMSTETDDRSIFFKWQKSTESVVVYISNQTPRLATRVSILIETPFRLSPSYSTDPPKVPPPPPPYA